MIARRVPGPGNRNVPRTQQERVVVSHRRVKAEPCGRYAACDALGLRHLTIGRWSNEWWDNGGQPHMYHGARVGMRVSAYHGSRLPAGAALLPASRNHDASIAAIQPKAAAVIAWRYT